MHTATRQIGIDMGHRVTNHGSKCRNIHGHRYTIEATIGGDLVPSGASEGMVLDFGFLKEEMMLVIDAPCDHGLVLWVKDPLLSTVVFPQLLEEDLGEITEQGYHSTTWAGGKLYIMDRVPTAENLAAHWFKRLAPLVDMRSDGQARLTNLKVWETPNCCAQFSE